jgi:hypothetical protein
MSKKFTLTFLIFFLLGNLTALFPLVAVASITNGTVDASNHYAWTENAGWLDWRADGGSVGITDTALSGYVWGENIGWLSLNCSNDSSCAMVDYKVANTADGALSGYAWSETAGWIHFAPAGGGVSINSSGEFSGYAWNDNLGWIIFNCAITSSCNSMDYKVATDWRPTSARPVEVVAATTGGSHRPRFLIQTFANVADLAVSALKSLVAPIWFKSTPKVIPPATPPPVLVAKTAPLSMAGKWNLIDQKRINELVLAPLPSELRALAQKFPGLEQTLKGAGITKASDITEIKNVKLVLPALTLVANPQARLAFRQELERGVPVGKLSAKAKRGLPAEVVFTQTANGLIDINTVLTINNQGQPVQQVNTIVGRQLTLTIKPDGPARSVTGYLLFRSRTAALASVAKPSIPFATLLASSVMLGQNWNKSEPAIPIERQLVTTQFEYTDPDRDGIYTATITAPQVAGDYEVMTVIDYQDVKMGRRVVRLETVVDPEGYVYEAAGSGKQTRLPNVMVILYVQDPASSEWIIWPAQDYFQENPQVTNISGSYAFLVSPGRYRLEARIKGYDNYISEPFTVQNGRGVHQNIELFQKWFWWRWLGQ